MVALRILKRNCFNGPALEVNSARSKLPKCFICLFLYSPIFLSHYIISLLKLNAILYDEQAEYIIIIIFYYFFKKGWGKYD